MIRASARRLSARQIERECDRECKALIVARDRGKCQWCGKPGVDWAHIHTRAVKSLRWNPLNSLLLCKGCHLRWHHHPTEGADWFDGAFPDRAKRLRMARLARSGGKLDRQATLLWLKQQRARTEG